MAEIVGEYVAQKPSERGEAAVVAWHADLCAGASPRAVLTATAMSTIAVSATREDATNKPTPGPRLLGIAIISSYYTHGGVP